MFKIEKGYIIIYRVFDIGDEVDLEKVKEKLNLFVKDNWTIKQNSKPSIIIKNPPLHLQLNDHKLELNSNSYDSKVFLKIWDYGVCSVSFQIPIQSFNLKQLTELQNVIEKDTLIDNIAQERLSSFFNQILLMIKKPKIWDVFEDYTLIFAESLSKVSINQDTKSETVTSIEPKEILSSYSSEIAHLLVGENKEQLSDSMQKDILSQTLQYSQKDLTIIDWNSAFVFEPSGSLDIPDLIEFVLTHQLEMRYYNNEIEYHKQLLSKNLNNKTAFLSFFDLFSNISVMASQRFLEFSDMIRKVDNSIETVGDFYLAKVIESANFKFNYKIRKSLDSNLKELQDEAERLGSKTQTVQSNFLSLLITLLIIIELIIAYIA